MFIPFLDKFPVDALVLQKRGNGVVGHTDQARYISKHGTEYYELKHHKTKFRPSTFDNMIPQLNGRPLVILYEYQRDMVVPVDTASLELIYARDEKGNIIYEQGKYRCENGHYFESPKKIKVTEITRTKKVIPKKGEKDIDVCPLCLSHIYTEMEADNVEKIPKTERMINLKAIEEDMAFWGQQFRREAEERHKTKGFLEQYWPVMLLGMTFIFYVILTYFFTQAISDTGMNIVDVYQQFLNTAQKPPG